jgi:hypothetical protein
VHASESVDIPTPEPIRRAVALTARGDAVVALIRFRRLLATLDNDDREYIAECLTTILAEVQQ